MPKYFKQTTGDGSECSHRCRRSKTSCLAFTFISFCCKCLSFFLSHIHCVFLCAHARNRARACVRVKGCALVYIFRNVCMYLLVSDLFWGPTPFLFYYLLPFVFLSFFSLYICISNMRVSVCESACVRAPNVFLSLCFSPKPSS